MKIVIFDNHPVVHDALQHFYAHVRNYNITGMYHDRVEVLRHLKDKEAEIVITEVISSDEIGIKWLAQVRLARPNIIIVVYTHISQPSALDDMYLAGADIIVHKSSTLKALHQALIDFVKISKDNPERNKPKYTSLTPKEKSIIQYIYQGLTAPEIAMITGTSGNTINNQKNHIIRKFGCKTSPEVIVKLISLGYISA